MGKLTIQEIAAVLMEKNGFDKSAANGFASAMFALIQERLDQGDLVKVKGLGTFKMIDVEARESVSVRTGERVVISGHSKVSFTPDAVMKELVNKPFSQFETVVLNDGVEFEDLKESEPEQEQEPVVEITAEPVGEQKPEPVIEPEPEPEPVIEPEPVVEQEEPEVQPLPLMEMVKVEESLTDETAHDVDKDSSELKDEDVPELKDEEVPELEDEEERRPRFRGFFLALGVLALMMLSAYGGYYYGSQQKQPVVEIPAKVNVPDSVQVAYGDSVAKDSVIAKDSVVAKDSEVVKDSVVTKVETEAVKPEPVDQYAAKDARVRLGAYRIVGLDREVKVMAGQTFYGICRANLGPDMECYVEVYNNLPQNPTIKEGQVIKIPKLALKKRRK